MGKLSEDARELLRQPIHAWATTVRPDGSLHSTAESHPFRTPDERRITVRITPDDVIFNPGG
ncbi:hypothetical protein [Streptosporangium sp. H16]|uniref:hypothetical protein n=1 Tax=Streptosporangium sp. H16 TaxID=3444184 RepID=UPI003F7ACC94